MKIFSKKVSKFLAFILGIFAFMPSVVCAAENNKPQKETTAKKVLSSVKSKEFLIPFSCILGSGAILTVNSIALPIFTYHYGLKIGKICERMEQTYRCIKYLFENKKFEKDDEFKDALSSFIKDRLDKNKVDEYIVDEANLFLKGLSIKLCLLVFNQEDYFSKYEKFSKLSNSKLDLNGDNSKYNLIEKMFERIIAVCDDIADFSSKKLESLGVKANEKLLKTLKSTMEGFKEKTLQTYKDK